MANTDALTRNLPFGVYHAAPATRAEGEGGPFETDAEGSVRVVGTVAPSLSASLVTGQKDVTNVAAQLTAAPTAFSQGFRLANLSTSISPIFFGPAGVTAATGDEIPVGQSVVLPVADASTIYVITAASTARASFSGYS